LLKTAEKMEDKFTIPRLKFILKGLGLPVGGNKAALVARYCASKLKAKMPVAAPHTEAAGGAAPDNKAATIKKRKRLVTVAVKPAERPPAPPAPPEAILNRAQRIHQERFGWYDVDEPDLESDEESIAYLDYEDPPPMFVPGLGFVSPGLAMVMNPYGSFGMTGCGF
jgi:hypothetical protein